MRHLVAGITIYQTILNTKKKNVESLNTCITPACLVTSGFCSSLQGSVLSSTLMLGMQRGTERVISLAH